MSDGGFCAGFACGTEYGVNMENVGLPRVLTIAGSDSGGGAGIQADLKTMTAFGCYGMSAITAITAQNTMGVRAVLPVTPDMVRQQLEAVFDDIRPDAVKIGMLANEGIIRCVADVLRQYGADRVVLDPVFVSTSGCALIEEAAVDALKAELMPLADIITPNIPEAEKLSGVTIRCVEDMKAAALEIGSWYGGDILVKGGHLQGQAKASDWLWSGNGGRMYESDFVDNPNTHGTGCTLSSAIACCLAAGQPVEEAVGNAKEYLGGALRAGLNLGSGSGPLNHMWQMGKRVQGFEGCQ